MNKLFFYVQQVLYLCFVKIENNMETFKKFTSTELFEFICFSIGFFGVTIIFFLLSTAIFNTIPYITFMVVMCPILFKLSVKLG